MSGSLLPLKTYASAGSPLWAAAGSGGGGGSNITSITNLSTITAGAGGVIDVSGDLQIFTNGFANPNTGFEVYSGGGNTTNAFADFDAPSAGQGAIGVRGYSTISGTQTIDTLFTMTTNTSRDGTIKLQHQYSGISTMGQIIMYNTGDMLIQALSPFDGGANAAINLDGTSGVIEFFPEQARATHSKLAVSTNTTIPQAGTAQNLGAFATTAGHVYDVRLPVRIDAVSQPTAGDWAVITTDSATAVSLASFDMTAVSTIGNQWEVNLCGTVLASGTTTTIQALGKIGAGTSTTVTVAAPSEAYIRDLGAL